MFFRGDYMRLGRDFTNLLEYPYLDKENKNRFEKGELDVPDMDAMIQIKSKRDIPYQIKVAKEIGLNHVELDGGIPNPYLEMTDEEIINAKNAASENNITLSLHLPYTYVAESICAFQESDRRFAVKLLKRYIDVASKLGCIYVNMHPGKVPFYQAVGMYRKMVDKSLIKSLITLAKYTKNKNILLHIENNTRFDIIHLHPEETIPIVLKLQKKGLNIMYCFDIGHWFTFAKETEELPIPPESVIDKIPAEVLKGEVHLNDFIPETTKFHPPLHYQQGPLKRENLINLIKKLKEKGVELIVVETAVREREELVKSMQILKDETDYLNGIIREVG
ncbi:MAG: sugar phosphate isomerase/epimerase family protein [Candidatus Hydrogenedentota bacterium]